MDDLLSDPSKLSLGGTKKELTILFSDIRNFTTISESLPPEEVVQLLNEYLAEMTSIVFKYHGTVDKFIGDAVMAFWGAPLPQEDHALLACRCAIEMIETVEALKVRWHAMGRVTFDIGVGLNTGEVIVGNIGSQQRMDYTVIGDNVNLASRLEGVNKQFHTHIIIGEQTYAKVQHVVEVRSLGGVKVKGKEIEVGIFELLGLKTH
jgi:adenylate cyclase